MKPSKNTIFIADDDEAILESVKLLLEMNDYTVVTSTGEDALSLIESHTPSVILLDAWMGTIDGKELCLEIKKHPQFARIPIIMISASNELASSFSSYGATDYVAKPFDIDKLIEKIELLSAKN